MPETWKLTFPVAKADADELQADIPAFADMDPPPAVTIVEIDPNDPAKLQLDVYLEHRPDGDFVALVRTLLPRSPNVDAVVELLPDEDWVTLSQTGLDPIRAGRFFVHAAKDADRRPADAIGLQIEASQAFGTGHHPTTAGCLRAIDRLSASPKNVLDLGTGTALLALGALKAFPTARVIASDIDPCSIDVARENIDINAEREGDGAGEIALVVADGLQDPSLSERAPYDLILANILAQPLIHMAADISGALADSGTLILAGLLADQAAAVQAAYEEAGLVLSGADENVGWPILVLSRPTG
ncbi:50S ribosomal protein L11 methyltransferase [Pacificimonas sp. ICDLI1SI03]